jgi:GTP-binding protein HflX
MLPVSSSTRSDLRVASERAVLVHVSLPKDDPAAAELSLRELQALVETAGAEAVGVVTQARGAPRPATYLGKGKVEELAAMVKELEARVVVFDNELSPNQIRELEKAVACKIVDRSELILDIFAGRATTRQAKLQVEIAQLEYTAPRLRAMWTHLGQVTGGAPVGVGTRGPGETQLETDRRLVQRRITQLKRELAEVLERKQREVSSRRNEHYTIGIVGYTNAGKSTLFNALTAGGAYAADKLFATLGTRVEQWNLGGGNTAMLSDTVGFVRNLPHHLVASFRSTLEETIHAHLLLIVLDASDPDADAQLRTVNEVLEEIEASTQPRLLVLNKIDRVTPEVAQAWSAAHPEAIQVSAASGQGLDLLRALVLAHARGPVREARLGVPLADARTVDFIEKRTEVLGREYRNGSVELRVRIGRRQLDQLLARGAAITVDDLPAAEALKSWEGAAPEKPRRERPHERHELMTQDDG